MNYLQIEGISKSYGDRTLFEGLSFGINEGDKVALIAKNGSGKTSILNMLAGLDSPDKGTISKKKGLVIKYLSQEEKLPEDLKISELIWNSDNPALQVLKEYKDFVDAEIEDVDQLTALMDKMEQKKAWDFESSFSQILSQLKINDVEALIGSLSGGQKKRVALAVLLIEKPDLLILDEPTNHLDLDMIEWLENYLKTEKITLFMVTHDRYFLECVCNEILELDEGELFRYRGNYSNYLEKRELRMQSESSTLSKAKNLYKKELEWMRRQPKARTTKAKSRISDFDTVKTDAHKKRNMAEVELEINMARIGNKIVEMHNLQKSYGDIPILNGFTYNFQRADRVGIIGKNGTGKTTFLNLLTEKESLDGGKIVIGETIKFGYYTQGGIKAKAGQKVIEVIKDYGDFIPLTKGRKISAEALLEKFLFTRKKQHDYVEKLSGGERKRLYLCTVLIQNPNFLILDEPTNDLDIVTLNVLEQFLFDFPGVLLVVSHDRYFMDKIIDKLLIFEGEGKVRLFMGSYSEYRAEQSQLIKEKTASAKKISESQSESVKVQPKKENKTLSYNDKREFGQLEAEIPRLEKKRKALEKELSQSPPMEKIQLISEEIGKLQTQMTQKEERWLELSMLME